MTTFIFKVELSHRKYGHNWTSRRVVARDASDAIRRAVKAEPGTYAMGVMLLAETD
jgi:hypothetical protein